MTNEMAHTGQMVTVNYVGTLEDGTEFDNSYEKGMPITFSVGAGQVLAGLDNILLGMTSGDKRTVELEPEDAYGEYKQELIKVFPKTHFPDEFEFILEGITELEMSDGRRFLAKIVNVEDENVVLDFNHPLAGKKLNFEVELMNIEDNNEQRD